MTCFGVQVSITAGMSLPRKGRLRLSAIGGVYRSSEVLRCLIILPVRKPIRINTFNVMSR